jgi:hypothetical protein
MKAIITLSLAGIASLALLTGCAHTPNAPTKSGFLYSYAQLKPVDPYTMRYIDAQRLPIYKKFIINPVKIMVTEFDGKPLTAEQRQKASEVVRQSLEKALSDKYPVVTAPGVDVGDIRIAITQAYKKGLQVGFTLEGEIDDSYSAFQAAAVTRSEIGDAYLGSWWDGPSFRMMVEAWAKRVREMLDSVDKK